MPAIGSGRVVSQTEVAQIFGVSAPTVRSWMSRGCPVVDRGGKGKPAKLSTAMVAKWREDQIALAAAGANSSVDYEEAKRRLTVAQARIAEVEADLKAREVVLIEDVVRTVVAEYGLVRNRILSIGSKIAPRAATMKSAEDVKALIDFEVGQALHDLSSDADWTDRAAARKR